MIFLVNRLLALILQARLCERNTGVCTIYVAEDAEMKGRLQHLLHPLALWCQFGGKFTTLFKLYGRYCWQPFLKNMLNSKVEKQSVNSKAYTCEHCEKSLGRTKPSVIFWAYTELYYFCSMLCRDKWLDPTTRPSCKLNT